jgi:hypothetical protein
LPIVVSFLFGFPLVAQNNSENPAFDDIISNYFPENSAGATVLVSKKGNVVYRLRYSQTCRIG